MAQNIAAAAAVRLTMRYPFWTELFYSMTVEEVPADHPQIKTEATDGRKLWINSGFWKTIPLEQQVSELVHELSHKMFLHCTRRGNRDPKLWNVACDYVINAMMKTNGFNIPNDWLLDMQYDGWLAEAVYADLLKRQKKQDQGQQGQGEGQPGQSQPGQGMPQMAPGREDIIQASGTPEQIEKLETEVKALVDRAIANAKAMGKLPMGIEAGTVEVYKASKEPWYNKLHRYMQSLSSSNYNWARLNRRTLRSHGFFSPLHLSEALGDIAVFIDTSGSCYSAAEQANFAGHLNAILAEARPHRIHLYYFDAAVYPGETIEAGELDIVTKPKGGGGTDFRPIFRQMEEDGVEPEVCIILTDLYGAFPAEEPEYPVVWACTSDETAPFGETMRVE